MLVCDLTRLPPRRPLRVAPAARRRRRPSAQPWRTALGWSYALLGRRRLDRARCAARAGPCRGRRGRRADRRGGRGAGPAGRPRRQRAAHDQLRPPLRRRRRPGRRAPAITYEGQAAIELEMMASGQEHAAGAYDWTLDGDAASAAAGGATRRVGLGGASAAGPAPARRPCWRRCLTAVARRPRGGAPRPASSARACTRPSRRSSSTCAAGVRASGGPAAVVLAGRRLSEPPAGRALRAAAGGCRLQRARRRPRARQRRRRLAGAGRGRGLYCLERRGELR